MIKCTPTKKGGLKIRNDFGGEIVVLKIKDWELALRNGGGGGGKLFFR